MCAVTANPTRYPFLLNCLAHPQISISLSPPLSLSFFFSFILVVQALLSGTCKSTHVKKWFAYTNEMGNWRLMLIKYWVQTLNCDTFLLIVHNVCCRIMLSFAFDASHTVSRKYLARSGCMHRHRQHVRESIRSSFSLCRIKIFLSSIFCSFHRQQQHEHSCSTNNRPLYRQQCTHSSTYVYLILSRDFNGYWDIHTVSGLEWKETTMSKRLWMEAASRISSSSSKEEK